MFVPQISSKVHEYLGHPGPHFPLNLPATLSLWAKSAVLCLYGIRKDLGPTE